MVTKKVDCQKDFDALRCEEAWGTTPKTGIFESMVLGNNFGQSPKKKRSKQGCSP